MAEDSKKKFYFTPEMDIILLKEIIDKNPFKNGKQIYQDIASDLRSNISFKEVERRTLQDRVSGLVKKFKSQQLAQIRRSGTEEQYEEREMLLQEVVDQQKEWTATAGPSKKREGDTGPAAVRKKAAKKMTDEMRQRLLPLKPVAANPILIDDNEDEADAALPVAEQPVHVEPERDFEPGRPEGDHEEQRVVVHRTRATPAARLATTLQYMENKLNTEDRLKREELRLKREELDTKKIEAENERLRLETLRQEQAHRQRMEEEKRKDEKEERKELMETHTKLMATMLNLLEKK